LLPKVRYEGRVEWGKGESIDYFRWKT